MPSFEELNFANGERPAQAIKIAYDKNPHVRMRVGQGAEVEVIETCGAGISNDQNSLLEVELGEGAILRHVRISRDQSSPNAQLSIKQERSSQYQLRMVSTRGKSSRSEVNVNMQGEGASCDLGGVTVCRDYDRVTNQVQVLHRAPRTTSHQKFHQIAFDHGQASIDSFTHVDKNVPHVEAHQSLRCLLMSPNAAVHAKPQLEIGNDDIQCSHAATVGTLDDDQLFYLRSRGIEHAEAETILLDAFINEVLEPIRDAKLKQEIRDQC